MNQRPGPSLIELDLPGSPTTWSDLGFVVVDDRITLDNLVLVVGSPEPRLALDPVPDGVGDWLGLPVRPISGQRHGGQTSADEAGTTSATSATTATPNRITGVDHIVIMTPEERSTVESIAMLGWEIRRERLSTIAGVDAVQRFVWAGAVLLEIVTPVARNQESDEEPVAAQVWGVSFASSDLDETVSFLGPRSGPPRAAVQPGRRIATLQRGVVDHRLHVAIMTARA